MTPREEMEDVGERRNLWKPHPRVRRKKWDRLQVEVLATQSMSQQEKVHRVWVQTQKTEKE